MGELTGCGDNSCYIAKPKVGTNGGCRCFDGMDKVSKLNVKKKLWIYEERIAALESKLKNHVVIKSSCPTSAENMNSVIRMGLWEAILEQTEVQYTEHGTAAFVEIRLLLGDNNEQ